MSRRPLLLIAMICLSAGGAAIYWQDRDPAPAIAAELNASVADSSNHAAYADLVRRECAVAGHLKSATFAAPCFWSGEGRFGLLSGVYRTTPGYLNGHEVVQVEYDPSAVSYDTLEAQADPAHALDDSSGHDAVCRFNAETSRASKADGEFHADDLPKWYIQQSELRFIPMTPAQATRINANLHVDRPVETLLSPMQNALLKRIRANPNANWANVVGKPLPALP